MNWAMYVPDINKMNKMEIISIYGNKKTDMKNNLT